MKSMGSQYRTGIFAVAFAFAVAGAAGAQTAGHQGHDTKAKAQTKKSTGMKMSMPAMDDAQFVEMTKKHHQDGIEMAKIEEAKGTRDQVKALAAKIRAGQERDLKELESKHGDHAGTAGAAGAKPQAAAGHAGHSADMQKHHEMMEQMAKESKQTIENASGAEVDRAFLQEIAKHHQMQLEMIAKTKFKDAELRQMAQKMAAEQKRELQEIKKLQSSR